MFTGLWNSLTPHLPHPSRHHPRPGRPPRPTRPRLEPLEGRCLLAADVILEWNSVLLAANAADSSRTSPEQGGPVLTANAFAIASVAMYDAYNSVEGVGAPFLTRVPLAGSADGDAAVAQAAHDTLAALFPAQRQAFDRALAQTLSRTPDGWREAMGRVVGAIVAQRTLRNRADDGSQDVGTPAYEPNGLPGFHAADPLHDSQGYYGPGAGNMAPFALPSTNLAAFQAPALDDGTPDGRLAFLQSQEYTDAYNEVKTLGGAGAGTTRTPEQTEIGLFWAYDGRPGLGTPPRLYNQIARTVATQQGNTEAQNARLFALLNVAMADAGIVSWKDKYQNDFWRPVLAVRNGDADGNPDTQGDPTWTPLGAPASNPRPGETAFTPPFPAYTSGHSTFGAAAFQTLERFFGRDDVTFSVTSDEFNGVTLGSDGQARPLATRTFASFSQAKQENALSRIYLGIHWRFDAQQGLVTGDRVADHVFDHLLLPTRGGRDGGNGGTQGHDRGSRTGAPALDGSEGTLTSADGSTAATALARLDQAAQATVTSAQGGAAQANGQVPSNADNNLGDVVVDTDLQRLAATETGDPPFDGTPDGTLATSAAEQPGLSPSDELFSNLANSGI